MISELRQSRKLKKPHIYFNGRFWDYTSANFRPLRSLENNAAAYNWCMARIYVNEAE